MLGFKLGTETVLVCKGEETEIIMREFAEADCAGKVSKIGWFSRVREFAAESIYVIHWRGQMRVYNKSEPWFRFKV